MAVTRRRNPVVSRSSAGFGLRSMRYRSKNKILASNFEDIVKKNVCESETNRSFFPIERLPEDILIRIICGVDHSDLKQLFKVSKLIKEAAKVAERTHFAYSTPKRTRIFRSTVDIPVEFDEIETPNAPKQQRGTCKPRLNEKKLAEISVQLFA